MTGGVATARTRQHRFGSRFATSAAAAIALTGGLLSLPLAALQKPEPTAPRAAAGDYEQVVPGLMARQTYEARTAAGGLKIAIWDLVVGPDRRTEDFQLPGGAVLQVLSGSGEVTVDDQPQKLELGTTVAVAAGQTMTLSNSRTDLTLRVRAAIVSRTER